MEAESVHVYTMISSSVFAIFVAFFLSSLVSGKLLKVAMSMGGVVLHAITCTISLLALVASLNNFYLPPAGMPVAILIGLFVTQFVLAKKLTPRLVKNDADAPMRRSFASPLRISVLNAALNVVFLVVAGIAVVSFVAGS